jgi:hypothetical protein
VDLGRLLRGWLVQSEHFRPVAPWVLAECGRPGALRERRPPVPGLLNLGVPDSVPVTHAACVKPGKSSSMSRLPLWERCIAFEAASCARRVMRA